MKRKNKRIEDYKIKNFVINLIDKKRILTYQSVSFLKMIKIFLEPLVTKAKIQSLHIRRLLLSRLYNQNEIVNKLFEIGKQQENRAGGYLRILRVHRKMDGSSTNLIEFVENREESNDEQSKSTE